MPKNKEKIAAILGDGGRLVVTQERGRSFNNSRRGDLDHADGVDYRGNR